jgi:hypothetical protein
MKVGSGMRQRSPARSKTPQSCVSVTRSSVSTRSTPGISRRRQLAKAYLGGWIDVVTGFASYGGCEILCERNERGCRRCQRDARETASPKSTKPRPGRPDRSAQPAPLPQRRNRIPIEPDVHQDRRMFFKPRWGSPFGGSTLITSAPRSARIAPAAGTKVHAATSSTRIPVKGWAYWFSQGPRGSFADGLTCQRKRATTASTNRSFASQNAVVPSPSARGHVEYRAMTMPAPGATRSVWP